MRHIVEKRWITGSGQLLDFYEILNILKFHTLRGAKIFIGTDSFASHKEVCFASAICLYGGEEPGRYFFSKEKLDKKLYSALVSRITEETRRSIEIACTLVDEYGFDIKKLELHLDVSPFSAGMGTSKFSEMLKGYVKGFGLEYRLKPDAWASQTIADKHSK